MKIFCRMRMKDRCYAKFLLTAEALAIVLFTLYNAGVCRYDVWNEVACNDYYLPENCNLTALDLVTLEDYDRCGPAMMTINARNYFLAAAGRRITYKNNKDAYDRIEIVPKMLRDLSGNTVSTTVLGLEIDFPVGLSPVAFQKIVSPDGEMDTVRGLNETRTIMIVSSFANTLLEDIADAVHTPGHPYLWMQTYIFKNRSITLDLVRRAEAKGFKAMVLTVDSPMIVTDTCDSRITVTFPEGVDFENIKVDTYRPEYDAATFKDVRWLRQHTNIPIVAKGILSGEDAYRVLRAGATAILVSNHGGRQMDGAPATIEALPGVVAAARKFHPPREVYVDGGVRSGHDVYKGLARGARMVFVGRPQVWGLAIQKSAGVKYVMKFLKRDFNETMLTAGCASPSEITPDTLNVSQAAYNQDFSL